MHRYARLVPPAAMDLLARLHGIKPMSRWTVRMLRNRWPLRDVKTRMRVARAKRAAGMCG